MLIRITAAGEAVLAEAEDFRRFSIRFDQGARGLEAAQGALARVARADGDTAWVAEAALRALAPRGGDPDWEAGLAGMIGFARSRGWVDDQGGIRAHIESAG
ncbi:hypothetical protein ACQW02_02275 [Humitalea sp. 24SJ18S-53]|uniref:hypothetical protein n=1 Tax=Humitalea sp. 24SJ18S-53 TaxID=3422307 RepID=UPI003D66A9C3